MKWNCRVRSDILEVVFVSKHYLVTIKISSVRIGKLLLYDIMLGRDLQDSDEIIFVVQYM